LKRADLTEISTCERLGRGECWLTARLSSVRRGWIVAWSASRSGTT